jgi:hypothetical protein
MPKRATIKPVLQMSTNTAGMRSTHAKPLGAFGPDPDEFIGRVAG